MMKGLSSLHLKRAASSRNTFAWRDQALTTTNFGSINCFYSRATLPGDHWNVNTSVFCRMAPLSVPTYGDAELQLIGVHVPAHCVAYDFEDYVNGIMTSKGRTTTTRWFTIDQLADFLTDSNFSSVSTSSSFDYAYRKDRQDPLTYYKFKARGRAFYKLLKQLQYDVPSDPVVRGVSNTKLNAMRFISFFKAYYDYMSRMSIYNTNELSKVLYEIRMKVDGRYCTESGQITSFGIGCLIDSLTATYASDYFTSAWRYPAAVVSAQDRGTVNGFTFTPDSSFPDTMNNGKVASTDNGVVVGLDRSEVGAQSYSLGARAVEYVQRLSDWLNRNNFVGGKTATRILSRFGVKPDAENLDVSDFIFEKSAPVSIGDITSLADTSSEDSDGTRLLGSYAGKGICSLPDGNLDFDSKEHGYFFIIGYLAVKPIWEEGIDRENLKVKPFDFYTPELDGMQASPISTLELISRRTYDNAADDDIVDLNSAFGFTSLYQEYRVGRSVVSGDMVLDADMQSWYFRRFIPTGHEGYQSGDMKAQSAWVTSYGAISNSQYNHIFTIQDDDLDHFYIEARFDVKAQRNMLDASAATGLAQGDIKVARNG